MNKQKGFTLIELMAVVCIIAILATMSLPVFNHYIEKSKAVAGIAAIGTFKNDVAVCFMKEDTFVGCESGTNGIHAGTDDINWINYVDVNDGVITVVLDATNHFATPNDNQANVTVQFRPSAHPSDAAMNWDIHCSDYNATTGTHLIDTCVGDLGPGSGSYF